MSREAPAIGAPPLPAEIQLEVTGACNLACTMCLVSYRPRLGRRAGALPFETFRRVVSELPRLERITLQGLGEPLLAPDIFRMVEYAAERGIDIGFNTNATLLSEERAARLVRAGLSWLHVSLDGATAGTYESIRGGSDFARVARNVRGLVRVMTELGAERPAISLVFVAMRRNVHELPDVVRIADEWGVRRLWVQNLSHSFSDTDPAGAYREIRAFAGAEALFGDDAGREAFAQARALADELGVDLRLPRLDEPAPAPRQAGTPGCDWPWRSAYVTHAGAVQPCCMVMGADRAVLGDLETASFQEIWEGEAYGRFREGLTDGTPPDVCRGCSLYRRVF